MKILTEAVSLRLVTSIANRLRCVVRLLYEPGQIDWDEGFADGTLASAKKWGDRIVPPA